MKTHDRKLGLCGVALTGIRSNPHDIAVATEVRDALEQVMISTGYLQNAPFDWVTLALRYGLKNEDRPHYERVSKEYGDLPVAIELDARDLHHASREHLRRAFMIATLKSLIDVGKKYKLPRDTFVQMLTTLQRDADEI